MFKIKEILEIHYPAISRIYEEGIATGHATFQTAAPSWQVWDNGHLTHSRLIATEQDQILGWAALGPVSGRCVYAGVAEVSIYLADAQRGRGIGEYLLTKLIESSEANDIWTLQSGIFPENKASIRIHEKCGFRIIGYREKIGKMGDIWRDNLMLERRSRLVGQS